MLEAIGSVFSTMLVWLGLPYIWLVGAIIAAAFVKDYNNKLVYVRPDDGEQRRDWYASRSSAEDWVLFCVMLFLGTALHLTTNGKYLDWFSNLSYAVVVVLAIFAWRLGRHIANTRGFGYAGAAVSLLAIAVFLVYTGQMVVNWGALSTAFSTHSNTIFAIEVGK